MKALAKLSNIPLKRRWQLGVTIFCAAAPIIVVAWPHTRGEIDYGRLSLFFCSMAPILFACQAMGIQVGGPTPMSQIADIALIGCGSLLNAAIGYGLGTLIGAFFTGVGRFADRFCQQSGAANGSQPSGSSGDSTSPAADSRR